MQDNKTGWLNKDQKKLHNKGWNVIEKIEELITSPDYDFLKITEIPFQDNLNVSELARYDVSVQFCLMPF